MSKIESLINYIGTQNDPLAQQLSDIDLEAQMTKRGKSNKRDSSMTAEFRDQAHISDISHEHKASSKKTQQTPQTDSFIKRNLFWICSVICVIVIAVIWFLWYRRKQQYKTLENLQFNTSIAPKTTPSAPVKPQPQPQSAGVSKQDIADKLKQLDLMRRQSESDKPSSEKPSGSLKNAFDSALQQVDEAPDEDSASTEPSQHSKEDEEHSSNDGDSSDELLEQDIQEDDSQSERDD